MDVSGTVAKKLGSAMALIPRSHYMPDSSKVIVKNVAGTALVLLIG